MFTPQAKKQIANLTRLGFDKLPVCVAKTQYSFSDEQTRLGAPDGFAVTREKRQGVKRRGFSFVALTGDDHDYARSRQGAERGKD